MLEGSKEQQESSVASEEGAGRGGEGLGVQVVEVRWGWDGT